MTTEKCGAACGNLINGCEYRCSREYHGDRVRADPLTKHPKGEGEMNYEQEVAEDLVLSIATSIKTIRDRDGIHLSDESINEIARAAVSPIMINFIVVPADYPDYRGLRS